MSYPRHSSWPTLAVHQTLPRDWECNRKDPDERSPIDHYQAPEGINTAGKRRSYARNKKRCKYRRDGINPTSIGIYITQNYIWNTHNKTEYLASPLRGILFQPFLMTSYMEGIDGAKLATGEIIGQDELLPFETKPKSAPKSAASYRKQIHKIANKAKKSLGKAISKKLNRLMAKLNDLYPFANFYIFIDPSHPDLRYLAHVLRGRRPANNFKPVPKGQPIPKRRSFPIYPTMKILKEASSFTVKFISPKAPLPSHTPPLALTEFKALKQKKLKEKLSQIAHQRKNKPRVDRTPDYAKTERHLPPEKQSQQARKYFEMKRRDRELFWDSLHQEVDAITLPLYRELKSTPKGRQELARIVCAETSARLIRDGKKNSSHSLPSKKLPKLPSSPVRGDEMAHRQGSPHRDHYREKFGPRSPREAHSTRVLATSPAAASPSAPKRSEFAVLPLPVRSLARTPQRLLNALKAIKRPPATSRQPEASLSCSDSPRKASPHS